MPIYFISSPTIFLFFFLTRDFCFKKKKKMNLQNDNFTFLQDCKFPYNRGFLCRAAAAAHLFFSKKK